MSKPVLEERTINIDEFQEIAITEHPNEGSLLYLTNQGSLKKDILFTDKLPVYSKTDGKQLGNSVIIVNEGVARGRPCYFVSVNVEAQSSPQLSSSLTLTAYVTEQLQTVAQSLYEVNTTPEGVTERIVEAIADEHGRLYISESVTDKEDVSVYIPAKATRGLILEGAEVVLFRLLAGHPQPQWFWFLFCNDGQLKKKSYSVTPGCSRQTELQEATNVTKIVTTIDLIKTSGAEGGGSMFLSSVDVRPDFALSISDLVRQARAEDGFDDNLESTRSEACFLTHGQCIFLSKSSSEWLAELPYKQDDRKFSKF
ncbi:hypothetical protein HDU96_008382 [Phlyctochytrium bullatum]|nr:hypothetical protein HDU96_008382 [Phlyctochytrium bullatum]